MRIAQHSAFLSTLLADVHQGRLIPAAFQRPYVWTQADVVSFFTSLGEGYPIGSALLWSPRRDIDRSRISVRRLGPVPLPAEGPTETLILDGQNRLATIAWAGFDGDPASIELTGIERDTWGGDTHLILDLAFKTFRFAPRSEPLEHLKVPAWTLVQSGAKTQPFLRKLWSNDWSSSSEAARNEALSTFDRFEERVRNAQMALTVLESATPEEALGAFKHICRVGVPMSDEDMQRAIAWTY